MNLKIDEPGLGYCEITEVDSIEGEAVANNRKGKLIFFYEWVLKLKWKGRLNGNSDEAEGNIEIPNLSEENEPGEIDVNVNVKEDDDVGSVLKELMRNKGTDVIREKIAIYIKDLRDDFAKDLIKPTKLNTEGGINSFSSEGSKKIPLEVNATHLNKSKPDVNGSLTPSADANKKSVGSDFCNLELKETMKCTPFEFYGVLTTPELVKAFSNDGSAVVDAKVDGNFVMFSGNVVGTFTHLEPNKCIKQRWRNKQWPEGHYSVVTIDLEDKGDCTDVTITQTGVPKSDIDRTEQGWKNYYFESMKRVFGFGALLH